MKLIPSVTDHMASEKGLLGPFLRTLLFPLYLPRFHLKRRGHILASLTSLCRLPFLLSLFLVSLSSPLLN